MARVAAWAALGLGTAWAALGLGAAAVLASGCGLIAGLSDHELAPDAGGAAIGADGGVTGDAPSGDAGLCGACPTGYACVDGRCGNEVDEVAASGTHACAVLHGGELWCWGKNQLGALGVPLADTPEACGDIACRTTPAKVPLMPLVIHVAVGEDYTCALFRNGNVSCFGVSNRLGHDVTKDPDCPKVRTDASAPQTTHCSAQPTRVPFPDGVTIAQIAAGADVACARTTDSEIYCWGDNSLGEVGKSPVTVGEVVQAPYKVPGIADATSVSVSATLGHVCVRRFFDIVWCWGSNAQSELGHPKGQSGDVAGVFLIPCNPKPQGVTGPLGGSLVSLGQGVSCVRRGDGTLVCFGANESAQLGNGTSVDNDPHPVPTKVGDLSNVVAVESRYLTGFAIDGAARVWAWGLTSNGATANGDVGISCAQGTCEPKPTLVPALEGALQIATGKAGGIARLRDGSVWAWGLNDLGQLAHRPRAGDAVCKDGPCRTVPVRIAGLP